MKIVMITHDTKIDRRIIHEAQSLISVGHEVKIVAFPWDGKEDEDTGVEIIRPVNTYHPQRENKKITYAFYKKVLKKILPMKLLDKVRSIYDLMRLDYEEYFEGYLLNLALQYPADVYHVHDLPSLSTGIKAAEKYHAKLVYDSHELFIEQGLTRLNKLKWGKIEKKYIHRIDHVITVNESIAEELSKMYQIAKPSVIMNKTQEIEIRDREKIREEIRSKYDIPYDKPIILYQGGIVESRNVIKLVDILKHCKENWGLVFLGSGDYRDKLKEYTKDNKNIIFIDEVSQNKLLEHTVGLADIGIIPYEGNCLNNYYCTPNKLFEFIAAGIPIVTNDLPEVRKVVVNNKIGKVVDINDIIGTSQALDEILQDQDLLHQYKCNIDKIKYEFSWAYEGEKIISIYNNL